MAYRSCRQCGQSNGANDAFCSRCGTAVTGGVEIAPPASSHDLLLDGASAIESPPADDGQRWQWTRAVLGLGSVVLALLIALSLLGGIGGGDTDADVATINDNEDSATDDDETAADTEPSPTPRPTATSRPATTPEPDDLDGSVSSEAGEDPDRFADWSRVTNVYDGGGVLVLQRNPRALDLIDLASGEWQTIESSTSSLGLGFSPYNSFATRAGVVTATGTQPTLRRWDETEPEPIGEPEQMVLGYSDEVIILGDDEGLFFGRGGTSLVGVEMETGRTAAVDLPDGFGAGALVGLFGSLTYPFAAELGDGLGIWTFDDGWAHLGPGNVIAIGAGGAVVQVCEVEAAGSLACAMETVTLDGTRTAVHPEVNLPQVFGTMASPDLRFVASVNFSASGPTNYQLTNLETGATTDAGIADDNSFFNGGTWLGASGVFAVLGPGQSLTLTNAVTGQSVEIDDVPWASGARTPMNPNDSMATWIDMPFPDPLPATE